MKKKDAKLDGLQISLEELNDKRKRYKKCGDYGIHPKKLYSDLDDIIIKTECYLYLIELADHWKIGVTNSFNNRLKTYSHPATKLISKYKIKNAQHYQRVEKNLIFLLKQQNKLLTFPKKEWFKTKITKEEFDILAKKADYFYLLETTPNTLVKKGLNKGRIIKIEKTLEEMDPEGKGYIENSKHSGVYFINQKTKYTNKDKPFFYGKINNIGTIISAKDINIADLKRTPFEIK